MKVKNTTQQTRAHVTKRKKSKSYTSVHTIAIRRKTKGEHIRGPQRRGAKKRTFVVARAGAKEASKKKGRINQKK